MSEPMTDERLSEIRARVKNAWAIQAVGPANMGDLEPWQLQSIAVAYVDDVADLLDEVDRLRAREQALAAENAAMRLIVEAVAALEARETRENPLYTRDDVLHSDTVNVVWVREQARAFIGASQGGRERGRGR